MRTLDNIYHEISIERLRQDEKWGEQNHDPFAWLSILGEEYGEACKAALEHRFGNKSLAKYRTEVIQVAAVAVAVVECLDRFDKGGIYLAGPIKGCEEPQVHEWRDYCAAKLNYKTINPAVRDFSKSECKDCMNEIVNPDKNEINNSSILLANCWQVSVGTSMEILYAWERGKIVISVVPENDFVSAWIIAHSHKIFNKLDEAIDYINGI